MSYIEILQRCLWPPTAEPVIVIYINNGTSCERENNRYESKLHYGHATEIDVLSTDSHDRLWVSLTITTD